MAELSAKGSVAHDLRQRSAANSVARRWGESIGLAALVGLGYFLAARLSIGLEPVSKLRIIADGL
jgi:hypothetical protein